VLRPRQVFREKGIWGNQAESFNRDWIPMRGSGQNTLS
jgi:hypothetical protein